MSFALYMLGTLLGPQRGSISVGWCYHEFFLTWPISSPSLAVPPHHCTSSAPRRLSCSLPTSSIKTLNPVKSSASSPARGPELNPLRPKPHPPFPQTLLPPLSKNTLSTQSASLPSQLSEWSPNDLTVHSSRPRLAQLLGMPPLPPPHLSKPPPAQPCSRVAIHKAFTDLALLLQPFLPEHTAGGLQQRITQ